ncbi:hypothetical protein ZWY2020_051051 [Hordeum vulgare]|nr:hypothetical protein ZWY2020_051051 [Hordeum vulgare]
MEEVGLFDGKTALLLASNPVRKRVLVLIHNGKPVSESQLIVQYVDEAFPASSPRFLRSLPTRTSAPSLAFGPPTSTTSCLARGCPSTADALARRGLRRRGGSASPWRRWSRRSGSAPRGRAGFFGGDTVGLVGAASLQRCFFFYLELPGTTLLRLCWRLGLTAQIHQKWDPHHHLLENPHTCPRSMNGWH